MLKNCLKIWHLIEKLNEMKTKIASQLCDSAFYKKIKRIRFKAGKIWETAFSHRLKTASEQLSDNENNITQSSQVPPNNRKHRITQQNNTLTRQGQWLRMKANDNTTPQGSSKMNI